MPNSALYSFIEEGYFDKMSCNRRNMGGYLSEDTKREKNVRRGGRGRRGAAGVLPVATQSWNDVDDGNTHENVFNGSLITKLNTASGRMRSAYKEVLKEELVDVLSQGLSARPIIFSSTRGPKVAECSKLPMPASGITICTKSTQ